VNALFFKALPGLYFDVRDERNFCRSISNKSMKTPRIVAVHLLNDFSSSPYTFSQALNGLQLQGYEIHLFTATPSGHGFLNEIWGIFTHQLFHRTSANKWLNRAWFLVCQVFLFFRVLAFSRSGDIVYINSMFPFGAALAGRLRDCKVLYHIQEVSIRPALLKRWLLFVINRTASHCLYISEYTRQHTNSRVAGTVVPNVLPLSFIERVTNNIEAGEQPFTVLMLCSLRRSKGVYEFVHCAGRLPEMRFELVLNASQRAIDSFFAGRYLPPNIYIHEAQSNVHPFYSRASVVVNLSLPAEWIEPFGMTALEAMYYRKPVIVPVVGGIAELVEDKINGFCVDAGDIDAVVEKIQLLASDRNLYMRMSAAAYVKAARFTQKKFRQSIIQTIHGFRSENEKKAQDGNLSLPRYPSPLTRFRNIVQADL
jgi:glycosyltransferase involved in cell wall biosynthesis